MSDSSNRRSLPKRIFLIIGGLVAFTLVFVIAVRLAVQGIFNGIEQSKATGLSGVVWEPLSMSSSGGGPSYHNFIPTGESRISHSAELRARSSSFDRSVTEMHQIVSAHNGYLEDLRTESPSRHGRALSANISVPSADFDAALSDLKTLGRIEAVSEAGEDSAVKLATAARHLTTAQTNLSRLQKLQRERKGELRDAVALEKDIAQASEAVVEAERQHGGLVSTVALAHIRVTLIEDYRAPMDTNWAGALLQLRNSFVEGVSAIFSSVSLFLGVLFEFGLPLLFWAALLFIPARFVWRRFRRPPAAVPAAS